MKGKVLRIFLAIVVAAPMLTQVLAISYEDLKDKLDAISEDINIIIDGYENEIDNYSEVINALSDNAKTTVEDLKDGQILSEDMPERLQALKEELKVLNVEGAEEFLELTKGVENSFNDMVEDNKDVINDLKSNYSQLSNNELKDILKDVKNIAESLGANTNSEDTYDELMKILNQAHKMAKDINVKLEDVIKNNVSTFESALSLDLVKELLNEVEAKDKEAVIDTLIEALDKAEGGKVLKADLKEIKADLKKLKNELIKLNSLSEQDLLMFSDSQKKDVAAKFKEVEKDYIDFAKVILDSYAQDYMDVAIDLAYDETVDQMIEYANDVLDYYEKYEDTVKSLTAEEVIDRLGLPEEVLQKAGLMVALGFVDTTNYNKEYVKETFKTQIEDMSDYLVQEFIDYLDHIDTTMNNEVTYKYLSTGKASKVQDELRTITAGRFTTISNLKALKDRVDTELLAEHSDVKSDVDEIAEYVYGMYNENILFSVAATLMKENDEDSKKYETHGEDGYILTNKFIESSDFTQELGIPSKHASVVSYTKLANNKVKTGSAFKLELSKTTILQLTFAVLGDTYADGTIDARDYMVIKNHIMEKDEASAISLIAADTYRDDEVDARDYMVIKNYIMKDKEITL